MMASLVATGTRPVGNKHTPMVKIPFCMTMHIACQYCILSYNIY